MDRSFVLLQQLAPCQAQAALLNTNADPAEVVNYMDDGHVQQEDLHKWPQRCIYGVMNMISLTALQSADAQAISYDMR